MKPLRVAKVSITRISKKNHTLKLYNFEKLLVPAEIS